VPDDLVSEAMALQTVDDWGGLPTLATMRKAEARPDASAFSSGLRDPVIKTGHSGRLYREKRSSLAKHWFGESFILDLQEIPGLLTNPLHSTRSWRQTERRRLPDP